MATETLREIFAEVDMSAKGRATFQIGDPCIHRFTGEDVVIIGGYQEHMVLDKDGDIVDRDGARVVSRLGYRVQWSDGKTTFCQAGALLDTKDRVRHIQLVRPHEPEPLPVKASPATPAAARKTLASMVAQSDAAQLLEIVKILSVGEAGFDRMLDRALLRGNLTEVQGELAKAMAERLGLTSKRREAAGV